MSEEWKPMWLCEYCSGNGVYLCKNKHKPETGMWAFRCHCSRGEADPRRAIPQFKQAHADEGFVYFEFRR